MKITIDKAIPKLQFVRNALNDDMEIAKAYDLAILIMRKYKKIEEIIKFGNANELGFEYVGEKITEVMEDA